MAAPPLHVVILAAGQGTRMRSRLPKVLHPVAGKPMLGHVIDTARQLKAKCCHIVHGHGAEHVRAWYDEAYSGEHAVKWVLQADQKGTAQAVLQALPGIPESASVLVLYADVPLVRAQTLQPLLTRRGVGMLTATLPDPHGYGRILRDDDGAITGIVEEKDADAKQRRIDEVNTGILVAPARMLKRWLPRIKNYNAKREYYLTDAVGMAAKDGVEITGYAVKEFDEVRGVNDPGQLAEAERLYQRRRVTELMAQGLQVRDPSRFDLRGMLRFASDVVLDVGVVLEGEVSLEAGVYVGPYTVLRNTSVGAGTRIESHCVLDGAKVGRNCRIGPYARLRPGADLGGDVHIGNFVEVKNSTLADGAKANHLAYLGDATVGERVNFGAGSITANYDGANKHRTIIGNDVHVGSNCVLVAPVRLGDGVTIGGGSTITKDTPEGGLTVARAKEQRHYPNWKRPQKSSNGADTQGSRKK